MAEKSKIEWTESTWNPVTGCTKISEGYALIQYVYFVLQNVLGLHFSYYNYN